MTEEETEGPTSLISLLNPFKKFGDFILMLRSQSKQSVTKCKLW